MSVSVQFTRRVRTTADRSRSNLDPGISDDDPRHPETSRPEDSESRRRISRSVGRRRPTVPDRLRLRVRCRKAAKVDRAAHTRFEPKGCDPLPSRLRLHVSAKDGKAKKGRKARAGEASVMGNLPSTRPARIGRSREPAPGPAAQAKPGKPAAKAKPRRRPAPPNRSAAASAPAPEQRAVPAEGPQPVRAGAPPLDDAAPASSARPAEKPPSAPQSGTQLVSTVVQAAGELTRIGFTVGGQVLKRAFGRLPRP